jgi:predicted PurR-regulated permease PerM
MVQALLGGFGLVVAGVPAAGLLTAVMFMLCIAQIGPVPVLLGAAAWVFYEGSTGWGDRAAGVGGASSAPWTTSCARC